MMGGDLLTLTAEAAPVVQELERLSDDDLLAAIGLRSELIQGSPARGGDLEASSLRGEDLVGRDDLRDLGHRIFQEIELSAWRMVCGQRGQPSSEIDRLFEAATAQHGFAAALTAVLIAGGFSPFIAPVAATLVSKLVVQPTREATCLFWEDRLRADGQLPSP